MTLTCARCGEPIGSDRDYSRHLGGLTQDGARQYVHFACRKCEICGETITGEYVITYVNFRRRDGGQRVYSTLDSVLDILYYHAACAYHAHVKPEGGGALHEEYGFYVQTAERDIETNEVAQ